MSFTWDTYRIVTEWIAKIVRNISYCLIEVIGILGDSLLFLEDSHILG